MRSRAWGLLLLGLAGCANPFAASYRGQQHGLELPGYVASGVEPQIVEVSNIDEEVRRAIRKGYSVVGYSAFDATRPPEEWQARAQARDLGAQLVLVRSRFPPCFDGTVPVRWSTTPALGTRVVAMSRADATSDYVAVFMAQTRPGPLAAELIEVGAGEGVERITGVRIVEVVEGGPASEADVRADDIVLAIDGQPVRRARDASLLLRKSAGRTVRLELERAGAALQKIVPLNR